MKIDTRQEKNIRLTPAVRICGSGFPTSRGRATRQLEEMQRRLREIAAEIGDQAARVILSNHGVNTIDEIADVAAGREIYREMVGYAKSLRRLKN